MEYQSNHFIHLQKRGILMSILFSLLTCGLYTIFWMISINNDLRRETNQKIDGGIMFLLSLITCGLVGLYWFYRMGTDLSMASQKSSQLKIGSSEGILYLILSFLGLGFITLIIMQHRENVLCEEK